MYIVRRLTFALTTVVLTVASEPEQDRPEPWGRIISLMEQSTAQGSPRLAECLKSLSPEEMLLGARQACAEVASRAGEMHDMPPEQVAEIYVMTCLYSYFDKVDRDEGCAALVKIVSDRAESPFFRRALIARMHERDEPFDGEFQTYVSNNEAQVTAVLTKILKGPDDAPVRKEAMQCLRLRLGRRVGKIIRSDPNVHAVWEQTHTVVPYAKMLRSGELTLTQETVQALKPLEAQTISYVKLLGAILADEENEPVEFRKQVRRRLEGYRKSALSGIDDDVEKALRPTGG